MWSGILNFGSGPEKMAQSLNWPADNNFGISNLFSVPCPNGLRVLCYFMHIFHGINPAGCKGRGQKARAEDHNLELCLFAWLLWSPYPGSWHSENADFSVSL